MPQDLRRIGERIEALVQELGELADPRARATAQDAVRLLMELYGGGLERMLEIIHEYGGHDGLFDRFADDSLVASLLLLHDLHPLDTETRVRRALDHVRPYLGSHGGDVKFLGIEDNIARLRLEGSCHGCPSSTVTMKLAIEKAIEDAAPEVTRVDVEGVTPPPSPSGLLQIKPIAAVAVGEWRRLDVEPPDRGMISIELGGIAVVLCRLGEDLYAYRSACPSCAALLDGARLHDPILECLGCGHRYDLRHAGQCLEAGELHLDPLPLLVGRDGVQVAVPVLSSAPA